MNTRQSQTKIDLPLFRISDASLKKAHKALLERKHAILVKNVKEYFKKLYRVNFFRDTAKQ